VLPAPLIAALLPGSISQKAIICAAIAAAQAAFYVAICEYFVSMAVEAVALKSRSAAVADAYANQGARAGSILPFTSALAGLCAAASAAAVEVIPMLHAVQLQCALAVVFPIGSALFASAASVAKSRCEVSNVQPKHNYIILVTLSHLNDHETGGCSNLLLRSITRALSGGRDAAGPCQGGAHADCAGASQHLGPDRAQVRGPGWVGEGGCYAH
jgi:hypothetical protein